MRHVKYPGDAVADACIRVDDAAAKARGRYGTVVAGQDAVYQAKYQAALAYQDNALNESPWLTAEADATGASVADVALQIITAHDQWATQFAAIEGERIAAKARIRIAPDAKAAFAIAQDACAKLDAL